MTSLMDPRTGAPWSTMPGWGIVADLTPPELIDARALKTLRRALVAALALVVVLCAGGYVLAGQSNGTAHDQLGAAEAQTTELMAAQSGYAAVTEIKTEIATMQSQLASLFASDIDVASIMQRVRVVLPKGMTLKTVNITPMAGTPITVGTESLTQVGTVTLGGGATNLDDLASYAAALGALPGFVQVVPSSNAKSAGKTTWTVTAVLTSELLSNRFSTTGSH